MTSKYLLLSISRRERQREKLDREMERERERLTPRQEKGIEKACCFLTPIHLSRLLYCLESGW